MTGVNFVRRDLGRILPVYKLIRDCIRGSHAIKANGELYLPKPDPDNNSDTNNKRYESYKKRARFYNFTKRTLSGLIGQVFSVEPVIELPTQLEYLEENANGYGVTLEQLAKKAVEFNLAYSRGGILVDFPPTENGATVAQLQSGEIAPTINVIDPATIINWRINRKGSQFYLSLVVIYESYYLEDDGFELKECPQFRVLKIDSKSGIYIQQIWREPIASEYSDAIPKKQFEVLPEVYIPKDANGNFLTKIPFVFFGSQNNDPLIDEPNFADLAELNIGHYCNSADYEEACYTLGQPTVVASGISKNWFEDVLNKEIRLGSLGGIPLPPGADAKLLQVAPNTMPMEAMQHKERQAVALGAKLVEQNQVQRTAFEAKIEATSDGSVLCSSVRNVNDAFNWALKTALIFTGGDESQIKFELNTDFSISKSSVEEQQNIIKSWQAGAIDWLEMRTGLRKAGTAFQDDEEAKTNVSNEQVAAMGLAMPVNSP